jgi:hypothetical protein
MFSLQPPRHISTLPFASILPCPLSRPLSTTPDIPTSDRDSVLVALLLPPQLLRPGFARSATPRSENRVGLEAQNRRRLAAIAYSELARHGR